MVTSIVLGMSQWNLSLPAHVRLFTALRKRHLSHSHDWKCISYRHANVRSRRQDQRFSVVDSSTPHFSTKSTCFAFLLACDHFALIIHFFHNSQVVKGYIIYVYAALSSGKDRKWALETSEAGKILKDVRGVSFKRYLQPYRPAYSETLLNMAMVHIIGACIQSVSSSSVVVITMHALEVGFR